MRFSFNWKILFFFAILFPALAQAASFVDYRLEMPLLQGQQNATGLSQYVKMFFTFGLAMVGVVALFAVVYSGFRYLISGSSDTKRTESKKGMWAALSGVILLIFSFAILYTINPQLVSLKEPNVDKISIGEAGNAGNTNSPYSLEMPLPGSGQTAPNGMGSYVKTFFNFGLAFVGMAALFAVVYGAFIYFISAGNQSMKTYGRKWIISALSGLTLLLLSFAILYTINPQLVSLKEPNVDKISIGEPNNVGNTNSPYSLEMPLPGSGQTAPNDLGGYIKNIFLFGLAITGMAALFAIAYGGIVYLLSAGSAPMQTHAKSWIWGAISGIILLICSFAILYTINPQLITLKMNQLEKIAVGGGGATNLDNSTGAYNLEMPLGNSGQSAKTPGDYVRLIFVYGLGLVGAAALFGLVYGGLQYIARAGSETAKTEGKEWILGALSGIALLICSYLILITINPQLVSLQNARLDNIAIPPHIGLNYNNISSLPDMNAVKNAPLFQDPVVMQALQDSSAKYNVPLNVAMFVAGIEHDPNNPNGGVSSKGARGIMQLMPDTARLLGVTDTSDPVQNINGGVRYLSDLYRQFGNWSDALAGYNAGPQRVKDYGGGTNIPFAETQKYLQAARAKGVI